MAQMFVYAKNPDHMLQWEFKPFYHILWVYCNFLSSYFGHTTLKFKIIFDLLVI